MSLITTTPAGTRPLTDFAPLQPFSIAARWLRGIGSRVYFNADDGLHGNELWVSDGTPQGTRRVTDFAAPSPFSPLLYAEELAEVGGRLVFPASDGVSPRQLWATGGAPASTAPLCAPGSCPQVQFSTTPSPMARIGESTPRASR